MYVTTATNLEHLAQLQIHDRTAAAARRRRARKLRAAVAHRFAPTTTR